MPPFYRTFELFVHGGVLADVDVDAVVSQPLRSTFDIKFAGQWLTGGTNKS